MVFNTTFNNISVISSLSILLVKVTRVPGENHWPATSCWQTLSHNIVSSTPHHKRNSNFQHSWRQVSIAQVVSCTSNFHTNMIMTSPWETIQIYTWTKSKVTSSTFWWELNKTWMSSVIGHGLFLCLDGRWLFVLLILLELFTITFQLTWPKGSCELLPSLGVCRPSVNFFIF